MEASPQPARRRFASRSLVAGSLGLLAALGCAREEDSARPPLPPSGPASIPASYVGSASCVPCHPDETAAWRGSHHDLALQPVDDASVLGRFDGHSITHFGVTTHFDRREGRPTVRTEGPDGALQDFIVTETFGVEPLQQYLVTFPDGRKQALGIAFDTRSAAEGGQRWFPLHPEERIPPGDPLHWTSVGGNWNHQCAECHSTQVRKGYDAASGQYHTTFAEADVGCEACHGPASAHLSWARREAAGEGATGDDPGKGLVFQIGAGDGARWQRAPGEPIARRSARRHSRMELETCARCHSRRGTLDENYVHGRPILDTHRVALLDERLYFADGQIQDEVFEYGSFLQSRMFAAGVTCSDCHDPHSLRLRAEGNALCGSCHAPEVFDAGGHHHHAAGSEAARCVSCHAPTRLYMEIDARHDHSFRVPRPDLSEETGAPNACTGCHAKRSDAWAADAIARWRGQEGALRPHFGSALAAGRNGAADAEEQLAALALDDTQPAIARATALRLLEGFLSPRSLPALQRGIASGEPLLRLAAAGTAGALPPRERIALLRPLLRDPVRAVRLEAVMPLAGVPPDFWNPADQAAFADLLAEYRAAQATALDQPESLLNLGNLDALLGDPAAALSRYEAAIRIAPHAIAAYVNRADLLRALGREPEAEATLREALARAPEDADVHYALGLALVRQRRMDEAVTHLGKASALAPDRSRYAVTFALALRAVGQEARATRVLEAAKARRPGDPEPAGMLRAPEGAGD